LFIDPPLSLLFVGDRARRWLDDQAHLKPSTLERYRGIVVADIESKWKSVKLADVSHSDVQTWVSQLSRSRAPAAVRKVHRVLSLILASAVMDGRLVRNPAAGVNLPRVLKAEQRYLTHDEVATLADAYVTPSNLSKHPTLRWPSHPATT
jgi:integrase